MIKKILIGIGVAFLSVLALGFTLRAKDADKYEMRRLVEAALRDPGSAQFHSDFVSTKKSGLKVYCGEVNAKNAFGGYVGSRKFVAYKGSARFEPTDAIERADFIKLYYDACTEWDWPTLPEGVAGVMHLDAGTDYVFRNEPSQIGGECSEWKVISVERPGQPPNGMTNLMCWVERDGLVYTATKDKVTPGAHPMSAINQ